MENRIKICWLGKKHQGKYVCFIPLTIDGEGSSAGKSLGNLQHEADKIIRALRRSHIQCNFTEHMVDVAIMKEKSRFNHIKKVK